MKQVKRGLQVLLVCLMCLYIPCIMPGNQVGAKAKEVTYTLKKNVENTWDFKMKGSTTTTKVLNVKESGVVSMMIYPNGGLGKNQEVRVKLLDKKGKTITSKKLYKDKAFKYDKYLKKGSYKLVFTTKNIKKNKTINMNFSSMLRNNVIYANGKSESMFFRDATYTFKNNKDQVVSMVLDVCDMSDVKLTVKDNKGKVLFKEVGSSELFISFYSRYMKKGTYTITINNADSGRFKIIPESGMTSKLNTKATDKKKAVSYKNKEVYLSYWNFSGGKKKQWLKVDTSDGDKNFYVAPALYKNKYLRDQNIREAKIKVCLYDAKGKLIKSDITKQEDYADLHWGLEGTNRFSVKKNTGVYYVSIEANSSEVVRVAER